MQIQITRIDNGWIVAWQEIIGSPALVMQGQQQPNVKQHAVFCESYEDVCEELKSCVKQ
jgi:hypothetical protein